MSIEIYLSGLLCFFRMSVKAEKIRLNFYLKWCRKCAGFFLFSVHIWLVTAGNVSFPHFLWTSLKSVCWSIHVCHLVTTSCHVLWTIAWSYHKYQLWFLYEQYHFKSIYNSNLYKWPNYILKITGYSFLAFSENKRTGPLGKWYQFVVTRESYWISELGKHQLSYACKLNLIIKGQLNRVFVFVECVKRANWRTVLARGVNYCRTYWLCVLVG